jgi:glutamate carboxypeptidase
MPMAGHAENANITILRALESRRNRMTRTLVELVEMESPTGNKAALDCLGQHLAAETAQLGARVRRFPQATAGDHIRAVWAGEGAGTLLLCHFDTVWDVGTLAARPLRIEDGRLYGPGAFDMKGGIANALHAIAVLRELALMPEEPITLLLTSDEETGSQTSRSLIEEEARGHRRVFVLEPAHPPAAALKTWRKGVGDYRMTVRGRAAHAGAAPWEGISAVDELARQILAVHALTDLARGTTVNAGVIGGGTRPNVVAEEAWADIDVRVMNLDEAARIDAAMRDLRPSLPGAALTITGGLNRPPMVRSPASLALFQRAAALAAEMGFAVTETGTGGGSDGNFTSALGVPTLDGLGVAGDGGHALHEHVILASIPERAALLAALLRDPGP